MEMYLSKSYFLALPTYHSPSITHAHTTDPVESIPARKTLTDLQSFCLRMNSKYQTSELINFVEEIPDNYEMFTNFRNYKFRILTLILLFLASVIKDGNKDLALLVNDCFI
jgi:hypothetical protein